MSLELVLGAENANPVAGKRDGSKLRSANRIIGCNHSATATTTTTTTNKANQQLLMENQVAVVLSKLALDNAPRETASAAQSLFNRCQLKRIHSGSDRALAAVCVECALESLCFGMPVQDSLVRVSSVDATRYRRLLKQVKDECGAWNQKNEAKPSRFSLKALTVRFGLNAVERPASILRDTFLLSENLDPSESKPEIDPAVFYVVARASGARSVKPTDLIAICNLNKTYFNNIINTLENNYAAEISDCVAQLPASSAKKNASTPRASASTVTRATAPSRTTPSRTTPSRIATTSSKISAPVLSAAMDMEAEELDSLLVIPVIRNKTPLAQKVQQAIEEDLGLPSDTTVTPTKRVARGGFRSTVSSSAQSRRLDSAPQKGKRRVMEEEEEVEGRNADVGLADEMGLERPIGDGMDVETLQQKKRNKIIGRQSMINWQEDAGTSKRCIKAQKWLEDMRVLAARKLGEKRAAAATSAGGEPVNAAA